MARMTHARDVNPVRIRREAQGLLLKELGQIARHEDGRPIGAPLLSMIEGGFVPSPETQLRIAEALDTTVGELWPDEARNGA